MREVIELSGFSELEAKLRDLPKATGKNVLRRIGKGALEPMADIASAKAPHRSGQLAYSITVSEKRTRRAKKSTTRYVGGGIFRAEAAKGIEIAMGPAGGLGTLQYAAFDEFGTVDTPAFGFMRAAWDAGANDALIYVQNHLGDAIDVAVGKRMAKLAKLGML
jgi:HK97 gp10 family phage protein